VINRLEEFSKAVNSSLDSRDFNTKREIIRALVKRIEIHKEEVVIVFRIDPEGEIKGETGTTGTEIETGGSSMQDCRRRGHSGSGQSHPPVTPIFSPDAS